MPMGHAAKERVVALLLFAMRGGALLCAACGARTSVDLPGEPGLGPEVVKPEPSAAGSGGQVSQPAPKPVTSKPAGPCGHYQPFAPPQSVPVATPRDVDGAWLSEDGLELIFAGGDATAASSFDLYSARRPSVERPFSEPEPIANLNTPLAERKVTLTHDGKSIFFASDRGGATLDVYFADRPDDRSPFGEPRLAQPLSSQHGYAPGSVSFLGDKLFFSANRVGGPNDENLYYVKRNGPQFDEIFLLSGVDSNGSNVAPVISPDELTIYFASTRGNFDHPVPQIYWGHRESVDVTSFYDQPSPAVGLSSAGASRPAWISRDECRLLLTRETSAGSGQSQLMLATRSPE